MNALVAALPPALRTPINDLPLDDESTRLLLDGIAAFGAGRVAKRTVSLPSHPVQAMGALIEEIDEILSSQINEILHHPDFQHLEATWQGLSHLLEQVKDESLCEIRVLDISKDELAQELEQGESGLLHRLIYFDAYERPGAAPYGLLVGDYAFSQAATDVKILEKVGELARLVHAPFIAGADPRLFQGKDFATVARQRPADLKGLHENPALFATWNGLRGKDVARFLGLVLPRVLLRAPYGEEDDQVKAKSFRFREETNDHDHFLWGNGAYALAWRIVAAFCKYGWHTAICGMDGEDGVVELPVSFSRQRDGAAQIKVPTEVYVSNAHAGVLGYLGFVLLQMWEGTDKAVFADAPSVHLPPDFVGPGAKDAQANSELSSDLRNVLAASRVIHYLRSLCQNARGTFKDAAALQSILSGWISDYLSEGSAPESQKKKKPLLSARITVTELQESPGSFEANVLLVPHVAFKRIHATVSTVARLPKLNK